MWDRSAVHWIYSQHAPGRLAHHHWKVQDMRRLWEVDDPEPSTDETGDGDSAGDDVIYIDSDSDAE